MSKKKRKKNRKKLRAQRRSSGFPIEIQRTMDENRKVYENAFQLSCKRVQEVLTMYHPEDVLTALNVSDLWQPNRSSQVKHLLALSLAVSTPADRFAQTRMATYEEFVRFCDTLIEALPDLPMLEDYLPEADWGEVKILIGLEPFAILHGGPVQRIVDFMEAFRISHAGIPQALDDLNGAIQLQSELLQQMPKNSDDQSRDISPGYIEVPPASYWDAAIPALRQLSAVERLHSQYTVELGQPITWSCASEFGDAVMTGAVLPWLAVKVDEVPRAVSLRNAVPVVIDTWAKDLNFDPELIAKELGAYLAKRIETSSCLTGPLLIRSRHERVPAPIAAILMDGSNFFLVVPVSHDRLEQAGKIVVAMRRVMQHADWVFQVNGASDAFQIRDMQGMVPRPEAVQIILVNTKVSTAFSFMTKPKDDIRLMSLVDACTIFDSIVSVDELAQFWRYVDGLGELGGATFSDLGDLFGSFRDAHAQIIEGAVVPDFLSLDPHWGASWRYAELREFWRQTPFVFPSEDSAWKIEKTKSASSLRCVTAKNAPKIAWSSAIGSTTLHLILDAKAVGLEPQDGNLLELFTHCAADSIAEREFIIEPYLKLPMRRVNLHCFTADYLLASDQKEKIQQALTMPLIAEWGALPQLDEHCYQARIVVNLAKLAHDLEGAKDACFEASCSIAIVDKLFGMLGLTMPPDLLKALADTATRPKRFTIDQVEREVDVPDFTQAQVPRLEDYKVARRDLAVLLKAQDVAPGKYTLDVAKTLINQARIAYRDMVHERIRTLDRDSLLRFCIKEYDALAATYDREEQRIKQSLRHEVDYDREHSMAEAHEKFIRESKNYRYLIETSVVITTPQASPISEEEVLSILAMVDWLLVLYSASDVLHNDIYVGGLQVDSQYVPEVFYSDERYLQQDQFGKEMAALRLGVNVTEDDRLGTSLSVDDYIALLDEAFEKDLKFTYSNMLQVLATLIKWVSVGGGRDLACGYVSNKQDIAERSVVPTLIYRLIAR